MHNLHPTQIDGLAAVDPITGFRNREALMEDLAAALAPGRGACVLAVFDLAGAAEYRRVYGYLASDTLIARLASVFAEVMAAPARLYRSREDEFWALLDWPADSARALVDAATAALRRSGAEAHVIATSGIALLPAEAGDPMEALRVADSRLGAVRRPRERRASPRP